MVQHDLVGCQSTIEVKKVRALHHIPDCIIAQDMTTSTQLTDLYASKKSHDVVHGMEGELRQWMKSRARELRSEVQYAIWAI